MVGVSAAAALGSVGSPGAESASKRAVKMQFGFTTYTWGKDWDIPTLIANCRKAKVFGVELRTSASYAHGVELELSEPKREEVKKQFKDSPVTLVGLAGSERFDWPEEARLKAAIESTKGFLKLSRDVGASGVRVFPNQFHPTVPRETTIRQIADALNTVGAVAADLGQEVRLEAHGGAGDLPTIRSIMDGVTQRSVRVKLNSDARDTAGEGFKHNFDLVKDFLGHTLHAHGFKDTNFPYQLQTDLLVAMNWDGWVLLEASAKVEDRVEALIEQRQIFDRMVAISLKA
jgi:sugar phosphate isomerase/epimerase